MDRMKYQDQTEKKTVANLVIRRVKNFVRVGVGKNCWSTVPKEGDERDEKESEDNSPGGNMR